MHVSNYQSLRDITDCYLPINLIGCSTKSCEFSGNPLQHTTRNTNYQAPWLAKQEVFMNTLALYTVLQEKGCAFAPEEFSHDMGPASDSSSSDDSEPGDMANSQDTVCKGQLVLLKNERNEIIIQ